MLQLCDIPVARTESRRIISVMYYISE